MRRYAESKSISREIASEDCFRLRQDATDLRLRQHNAHDGQPPPELRLYEFAYVGEPRRAVTGREIYCAGSGILEQRGDPVPVAQHKRCAKRVTGVALLCSSSLAPLLRVDPVTPSPPIAHPG